MRFTTTDNEGVVRTTEVSFVATTQYITVVPEVNKSGVHKLSNLFCVKLSCNRGDEIYIIADKETCNNICRQARNENPDLSDYAETTFISPISLYDIKKVRSIDSKPYKKVLNKVSLVKQEDTGFFQKINSENLDIQ